MTSILFSDSRERERERENKHVDKGGGVDQTNGATERGEKEENKQRTY